MKILFDVTPAQKKKILEILKLSDVVETAEPAETQVAAPAPAEATALKIADTPPVEPDPANPAEPVEVTREEVAAAVLVRAKLTNSSDAITILERSGGSPQLSKILSERYPAVLAALQAPPVED